MNVIRKIGSGAKSVGKGIVKVGVVILDVVAWVGGAIAGLLKILD